MIAPSGSGSFPSRYALIVIALPRMARISLRLPSSWATEINLQSRYPGGMLLTKIGELCWLLVLVPTASAIMAPVLSPSWGLVCCACAFCMVSTTEMVRAEAIMMVTKWFFIFSFCLFEIFVFAALVSLHSTNSYSCLCVILPTYKTARIPLRRANRNSGFRRGKKRGDGEQGPGGRVWLV